MTSRTYWWAEDNVLAAKPSQVDRNEGVQGGVSMVDHRRTASTRPKGHTRPEPRGRLQGRGIRQRGSEQGRPTLTAQVHGVLTGKWYMPPDVLRIGPFCGEALEFDRGILARRSGAYDIVVSASDMGLLAVVSDLPGCPPTTVDTAVELETTLRQTIETYLDAHPEAPAHYVRIID